jgi:hypothetical protein
MDSYFFFASVRKNQLNLPPFLYINYLFPQSCKLLMVQIQISKMHRHYFFNMKMHRCVSSCQKHQSFVEENFV